MNIIDAVRDATTRAIELGVDAAYFFRDLLFGAPPSESFEEPYSPPFSGGQCEGNAYTVVIGATFVSGSDTKTYYFTRNFSGGSTDLEGVKTFGNAQPAILGAIPVPSYSISGITGTADFGVKGSILYAVSVFEFPNSYTIQEGSEFVAAIVNRTDSSDSCGDPPNPNPTPTVPNGGVPAAPYPDLDNGSDVVVEGLIPPNWLALLNTALAALALVDDILDLGQAIGDAIDKLKDLLQGEDDEDKKYVDIISYNFGSISKDGFLRLYPQGNQDKYSAMYVDIQIAQVPVGFGRFFGLLSPNRYRYRELGYIAFVSPTFGVFNVQSIEFQRMSVPVPTGAIGFYYHLGLIGAISANATGFYEKRKEPEE